VVPLEIVPAKELEPRLLRLDGEADADPMDRGREDAADPLSREELLGDGTPAAEAASASRRIASTSSERWPPRRLA